MTTKMARGHLKDIFAHIIVSMVSFKDAEIAAPLGRLLEKIRYHTWPKFSNT